MSSWKNSLPSFHHRKVIWSGGEESLQRIHRFESVHECSVATFRNIDSDKTTKRQVCRDVTMDAHQKAAWQRLRGGGDESEAAEEPADAD